MLTRLRLPLLTDKILINRHKRMRVASPQTAAILPLLWSIFPYLYASLGSDLSR